MAVQVYFIGAGPGSLELLTIKAKHIIEQADVIIYADSLINPDICAFVRKDAQIYRSASLNLEEITGIIEKAVSQRKIVARLQSGDPSIYGAILEQMNILDKLKIDYEIIPGVSSVFAAAAALKTELTVPELSQAVIITRVEGKTPVPARQKLRKLASPRASLVIFLSTALAEEVTAELIAAGYHPETKVAVVYRASLPDEIVLRTNLKNLVKDIKVASITKQALILVGSFLDATARKQRSKLYNQDFTHGYRQSE